MNSCSPFIKSAIQLSLLMDQISHSLERTTKAALMRPTNCTLDSQHPDYGESERKIIFLGIVVVVGWVVLKSGCTNVWIEKPTCVNFAPFVGEWRRVGLVEYPFHCANSRFNQASISRIVTQMLWMT